MQGINSREHRILAEAFNRFESMSKAAINKLDQSDYNDTVEAVRGLDVIYDRFQSLYIEMENCIKEYESKKKTVRSMVNKGNRKLIEDLRRSRK